MIKIFTTKKSTFLLRLLTAFFENVFICLTCLDPKGGYFTHFLHPTSFDCVLPLGFYHHLDPIQQCFLIDKYANLLKPSSEILKNNLFDRKLFFNSKEKENVLFSFCKLGVV
ncbi:hypothetical protein Mgra_00006700, partial [Meloidogyne graminicola]